MDQKSFWNQRINIGKLSIPKLMAAPLDGITDSPMRQLIRLFSKDELLFTEMRHVCTVLGDKRNESLRFKEMERPLAFQFSANKVENIREAVEKVLQKGVEMINLNVGCPARNVVNAGGGSALMADLPRLGAIIKEFKTSINDQVPFTIKIRSGFKEKNAVEVSMLAQDLGVEGIIIHPRTKDQAFGGLPDNEITRKVRDAISIPLIFSGNINSFARAQKVYNETGVDGFMIGRALWGYPWKMHEILMAANGEKFEITSNEMIKYGLMHLRLIVEHYGARSFNAFKKQLPSYIKSVNNAAEIRKKLVLIKDHIEMENELLSLLN